MTTQTLDTAAHATLQAICARCRSFTRVHVVYRDGGKLYADIRTELEDPGSLSRRFYKAGYQVNQIDNLGGDYFRFTLVKV